MGNPAGVRAKKSLKRRLRHEKRLKIGRFVPKPEKPKIVRPPKPKKKKPEPAPAVEAKPEKPKKGEKPAGEKAAKPKKEKPPKGEAKG